MLTDRKTQIFVAGESLADYDTVQAEPVALVDEGRVRDAVEQILAGIGEDPLREGLLRTPDRVARMFGELTAGYHVDPDELINDAIFSADYDEMVVVKDIEFYSLCEHHMLPFFGKAHVA